MLSYRFSTLRKALSSEKLNVNISFLCFGFMKYSNQIQLIKAYIAKVSALGSFLATGLNLGIK